MILYHFPASFPARFVLLSARNLDVDLEVRNVDLSKGEHLTPEFLKINPLHQIPVLVDGDFKVSDSRAIACYLVNKKREESSLYPRDPQKRALIDQRLYMDASYVAPTWYYYGLSQVFQKKVTALSPEVCEKIDVMLQQLNNILSESKYFCGEDITLADLSIVCSIGVLFHAGLKLGKYPKLAAWYESMKSLKGWAENDVGAEMFGSILKNLLTEPL